MSDVNAVLAPKCRLILARCVVEAGPGHRAGPDAAMNTNPRGPGPRRHQETRGRVK